MSRATEQNPHHNPDTFNDTIRAEFVDSPGGIPFDPDEEAEKARRRREARDGNVRSDQPRRDNED